MKISIRPAAPGDAPGIARVHVDSWRTSYRGLIPDETLEDLSVERREGAWLESIRRDENRVYVAEEGGRIVGFICGGPEREGVVRESDGLPYDAELYAIYILEEHQGRGIGSRLLARLADQLSEVGFERMLVWVLTENETGCRFYEARGARFEMHRMITMVGVDLEETGYGWDLPL